MKSDLGEVVQFERTVSATGSVELWLNSLLTMVKETVKTVLASMAQNVVDPEYDFIKGFLGYCGQVNWLQICFLLPIFLPSLLLFSFQFLMACRSHLSSHDYFRLDWSGFKYCGPRKLKSPYERLESTS